MNSDYNYDHVNSKSRGGDNSEKNVQVYEHQSNNRKKELDNEDDNRKNKSR